jgi:heptosyltransferase I
MTKKVLLVKTSSLGDLIHNLPAVNDIRAAVPGAEIDWVIEEPFLFILRLHPGVAAAIPVAIRRWRRTLWRRETRAEIAAFLRHLRAQTYNAVIDSQGLMKSALIALAARGTRYGLDFHSAREPLALLYHHTFRISWELHAVERNRLLMARALDYEVPQRCSYGISAAPRRFDWLAAGPYAVLLHATSGDYKLWHERNWVELGNALESTGLCCVLPWGSARERERSVRLASGLRAAVVPPALSLDDLAGLFAGAKAVVGVDTGLAHLAAALGVQTVGIYCATDPAATGIYGCARALNLGGIGNPPAAREVIAALDHLL